MNIDLRNETVISLSQAARMLPPARRGRPVTISCVLRWLLNGVKLPSGGVVRLEAIRVGGRWLTSVEALERFAVRQTPNLEATPVTSKRTSSLRRRETEKAEQELAKNGI